MDIKEMLELTRQYGVTNAAVITTDQLVFVPEYRKFCEANDCGNYNNNYACPPYSGEPEEMRQNVMKYKNGLVMQACVKTEGLKDSATIYDVKVKHAKASLEIMDKIAEADGVMGLPVLCGPCTDCKECMKVKNLPCPHPDRIFSCLSAYCIDITDLAAKCNMPISWDGKEVSFFTIYFFN